MSMLSKMKIVAFGLLGAVMFFAAGNNVLAVEGDGTPDGSPPAEEIVCDGLSGASFGLCNAYCEAMDCDSGFPAASQNACDKVAAKFAKHSDGAPLPCEVVEEECPCVTQREIFKAIKEHNDRLFDRPNAKPLRLIGGN